MFIEQTFVGGFGGAVQSWYWSKPNCLQLSASLLIKVSRYCNETKDILKHSLEKSAMDIEASLLPEPPPQYIITYYRAQHSQISNPIPVQSFLWSCALHCNWRMYTLVWLRVWRIHLNPTTRMPNSCLSCSSQKPPSADISETESAIIDTMVSKRPEKIRI